MEYHFPLMRYYKRDGTLYLGNDILLQWAQDFKDPAKKIVKQDLLSNGIFVSTVWLGLDHRISFPGLKHHPHIFETMVFFKDCAGEDQWRYSTEEEALLGHKMMVKKWSSYKTVEEIWKEIKSIK